MECDPEQEEDDIIPNNDSKSKGSSGEDLVFQVHEDLRPEKKISVKSKEDHLKDLNYIKRMSV